METIDNSGHKRHDSGSRAIIGVILVLAGFFLLLRNTNIFPWVIDQIIFSWQMLLIAIGLIITLSSPNKTPGIIVMAVGAFFLLPEIFHDIFGAYRVFWPAVFIIAGVLFITGGRKAADRLFHRKEGISSDDYIDIVNIFSGGDRQVVSDSFNGGKITAVFGGSKVDLTKCKLAPGVSELDLACVFGGTEIIVPEEWNVVLDVVPVLGGFSDERKISSAQVYEPGRQLVIKGTVVFGGGDLKSY